MSASAATLFAWHLRPGAFERLVPPGDGTRVIQRTGRIQDDTMRVELSVPVLGPVRQRWRIRHEGFVAGERFVDVMERGPFSAWRHEHRAIPIDRSSSELLDSIVYRLPLGALGRVAGRQIVENKLKTMFRHRHQVTAGDLAAHVGAGLSPLVLQLDGAVATSAGTQIVALLLTGGHEVLADVAISGYEPPPTSRAADVWVQLEPASARISAGRAASVNVQLIGDPVQDPRRVLAGVAEAVS